MTDLLRGSPIPSSELLFNLHLYQRRQDLSRVLFLNEIYQKPLPIHGYILEFGSRYGASTATLINLRGMHEPFNYSRKIITFDTFGVSRALTRKTEGDPVPVKLGRLATIAYPSIIWDTLRKS